MMSHDHEDSSHTDVLDHSDEHVEPLTARNTAEPQRAMASTTNTVTVITSDSSVVCFGSCAVFAVPVVGFSEMFADLVGYQLPDAPWVLWVSPFAGHSHVPLGWLAVPDRGGLGGPFARKPGMMLFISLAISVAFIASMGASLQLLDAELGFGGSSHCWWSSCCWATGSRCVRWPKPPRRWILWLHCFLMRRRRSTETT
jgi:Cu2+-exporting ATPase